MTEGATTTEGVLDASAVHPHGHGRRRRRGRGLWIALSVLLTFVFAAHYYFVLRLIQQPQWNAGWTQLATLGIWAAGASLIVHPLADRRFGPRVGRVLGWPANLWLAACFYLLVGLGASDLVLAITGLDGTLIAQQRAQWVAGGVLVVLLTGMTSALSTPRVKQIEVKIPGLPQAFDGYRLVQISDVHIGTLIGHGFAQRVTERINELAADAVAITGDLVDGSVLHIGDRVAPFGEIRARDGVFFVTGNHDFYSGAERWSTRVAQLGIEVLRNRRVAIERGGACFYLVGVDDYSSRHRTREDLARALEGWDEQTPAVLLAHDPRAFKHARERGVHLQLSGHTHGGQMWPFSWLVRLQSRWVAGLYREGRSQLYVSRGTGYWGPPVRVLAPAEIGLLVLRSAPA